MNPQVVLVQTEAQYPDHPYLEPRHSLAIAFGQLWRALGLDPDNPFGGMVGPGSRVTVKPNWVMDHNPRELGLDSLVTHSSVLAWLIHFVAVAMRDSGSIVIGDCPLQSCRFDRLLERTGFRRFVSSFAASRPELTISVEDWRLTHHEDSAATQSRTTSYETRVGRDYELLRLDGDSFLEEIAHLSERFRVTCYDPGILQAHHGRGRHEYLLTRRALDSDLLLNVPKLKTHKKAGLTAAMKNLVGVCGHKEYLPHHISGPASAGGDCYRDANKCLHAFEAVSDYYWSRRGRMSKLQRKFYGGVLSLLRTSARLTGSQEEPTGSWYGNEVIWRTTLDLNHLVYFGSRRPRHILNVVDGVVAGQGEGPLEPHAAPCGLLAASENPAYLDAALAQVMGYSISRVPTVYNAIHHRQSTFGGLSLRKATVEWVHNGVGERIPLSDLPRREFAKPAMWRRAESMLPSAAMANAAAPVVQEEQLRQGSGATG